MSLRIPPLWSDPGGFLVPVGGTAIDVAIGALAMSGGGEKLRVVGNLLIEGTLSFEETSGPTQLTTGAIADGEVLTRSGTSIVGSAVAGMAAPRLFYADQLDNPNNADWTVNALAPASADSNNAGLTVRLFDDTIEEGVGFILSVPAGVTSITLRFKSRAETTPGGAVGVVPTIYNRNIPDNAAVGAWTAGTDLTALAFTTNEFFQYDSQTITLAALSITAGNLTQFELTRNGAAGGDDLVGDWALIEIQVEFT